MVSDLLYQMNNESYSEKVSMASEAFRSVKSYLSGYMTSSRAYDGAMAIALSFFASDYSLSGTEAKFFNDFLGQSFEFHYIAEEYHNFKSSGLLREARNIVINGPESVRKHALLLAGVCIVCDRQITSTEVEDFTGFANMLNLSYN